MRWYRNGVTLIELAIVLLIIAVLVTVVFPKFHTGLLDGARFRSSVNRIASVAEYAHQRAACAQLTHSLHLDVEKGTYWVTSETSDGQTVLVADGISLKGRLPEGVRFGGVEFPGINSFSQDAVTIKFSPQGWAEPAKIYVVSSQGETMSIVIDELSGHVETCELVE